LGSEETLAFFRGAKRLVQSLLYKCWVLKRDQTGATFGGPRKRTLWEFLVPHFLVNQFHFKLN